MKAQLNPTQIKSYRKSAVLAVQNIRRNPESNNNNNGRQRENSKYILDGNALTVWLGNDASHSGAGNAPSLQAKTALQLINPRAGRTKRGGVLWHTPSSPIISAQPELPSLIQPEHR